jgi:two-component system CheB/CheR fusion protein
VSPRVWKDDHTKLEWLYELSSRLISEDALPTLLQAVIDAAVDLTHAHMGTLQLYDETSQSLQIAAHHGFQRPFLDHFSVLHEGPAVCGEALRRGERVIVEDVSRSSIFLGTPTMAVMEAAGVRAVQSTQVVSRDGRLLGMISTHWTEPHRPEESTLRLLDLLAREAGRLIEDRQREEALRKSEAFLAEAQRVLQFGSWEWDIRSGTLTWSKETFRIFCFEPGVLPPSHDGFAALVHPEDRSRWAQAVEQALAGGVRYDIDYRILGRDGSIRWIQSRAEVARDESGTPVRMTGVALDVTELKRFEEELRAANERLVEADRRKNEFLAILSHELRNPLAPIRNSLHILERAAPGGERAKRAQAVIERQVGQMTRLVEDLLDLTRITRGKIQLRRELLDLDDLARRTVEDHRSLFAKSEVRLETGFTSTQVLVDGDRTRLTQAIGNLLQNAAKFTPRGGTTTVSVEEDASHGTAILRVKDTGVGIAPEILPRLFEPFTQADRTLERSKGGLGIGLALVKRLTEMQGGSVHGESHGPEKGSTFTITLPLAAAPQAIAQVPSEPPRDRSTRRVLIIEDNVDGADSLRMLLEDGGHVVEVAYSGSEGIEKARVFKPDIVLCDIGLPGMDGYAVAKFMRGDPVLGHICLVALTGYVQPKDVALAKESGFDTHLAKPPTLEAIEKVVGEVQHEGRPEA